MASSDIAMLKEYVTAPGNFGANHADSTVLLHITHSNLRAEFMEIRLDKHVRHPFVSGRVVVLLCLYKRDQVLPRTTKAHLRTNLPHQHGARSGRPPRTIVTSCRVH